MKYLQPRFTSPSNSDAYRKNWDAVFGDEEMLDPVQRLSRAELQQRAEMIAREWLNVSVDEAWAMLERGELDGKIAGPELKIIRLMLS